VKFGRVVACFAAVLAVAALEPARNAEPFQDVTAASGVGFVLQNASTTEKHQIETMPGGVALFDYDNDGRLDIFFTNGAPQPSLVKGGPEWYNRLYRNLGEWKFEDVTAKAGVQGSGYDFGVAAGDYDNDGFTDLYVAGLPHGALYRNRGDGTFVRLSGTPGGTWPIAAGWFDYDRDGWLDLFVVNYVRWDPKTEPFCGDPKRTYRTYCHPQHYDPLANTLYRNNRDGTFADVSEASRIGKHRGKGMAVAFADYDSDADLDVLVANDTYPNFLFRNEGDGTFTEVALGAGVAFNDDGRALSSMGVDFRDVDNDGREDLFITALANETFPLYRNLGRGLFADVTYPSRVGAETMPLSGWSNGIYDFDNDGWKDLFAANGDVQDNTELFSSRKSKQSNLLLLNRRDGTFAGTPVGAAAWHRGAAFGDVDNDGDIDVVITRLNESPVLLRNSAAAQNNWIGFRVTHIGVKVRITTASGDQYNHTTTSVGYASSSDMRVHFGLGENTEVKRAEITWPSGDVERLTGLKAGAYVQVGHGGRVR
jgi:hypothetical protein